MIHRNLARSTSSMLTALTLLIASPVCSPAQQGDAREINRIMRGLRGSWSAMAGLSARFTHTFVWVLAGETQVTRGQIWLGGRDRFRVETPDRIVVSDGSLMWDYSPHQKQVLLNKVDPGSGIMTQQQLFAAYTEDVTVEWVGSGGTPETPEVTLRLNRPAGADPQIVEILVDTTRMLVKRAVYADAAGNRHTYDLSELLTGEQPSDRFQFTVPEGVRVIDIRPGGGP